MRGGGAAAGGDLALTRWPTDRDARRRRDSGSTCASRRSRRAWSPTATPARAGETHVPCPHGRDASARPRRSRSASEVCVAPDDDVEVRLVTLAQRDRVRGAGWTVTSYAEVVLGDAAADRRHPAFSKLFVESEYVADRARPALPSPPALRRAPDAWLAHLLVAAGGDAPRPLATRPAARTLPRARRTAASAGRDRRRGPLGAGMTGATLDPVMALAAERRAAAAARAARSLRHARRQLARGGARARPRATARSPRSMDASSWRAAAAATELADLRARPARSSRGSPTLLSLLLYSHGALRASPPTLAPQPPRAALACGSTAISGDLPILLVRIGSAEDAALLPSLLRAPAVLARARRRRRRGDPQRAGRAATRPRWTSTSTRAIVQARAPRPARDRPGGVFVVRAATDRPEPSARCCCRRRASCSTASQGRIAQQLARVGRRRRPTLPLLAPSSPATRGAASRCRARPTSCSTTARRLHRRRPRVRHPSRAGRSRRRRRGSTCVANPRFGFVVIGVGRRLHVGGEQRREPADAVAQRPGRRRAGRGALSARRGDRRGLVADARARAGARRRTRSATAPATHGFEHRSHGLEQELRALRAAPTTPSRSSSSRLTNASDRPRRRHGDVLRRVGARAPSREQSQPFVVPEFDPSIRGAAGAESVERRLRAARRLRAPRAASCTASPPTAREFLGRHGRSRAARRRCARIGLASTVRAGARSMRRAAGRTSIWPPGETRDVAFPARPGARPRRGAGARRRSTATARSRRGGVAELTPAAGTRYSAPSRCARPIPALDLMLNRWLLYQALAAGSGGGPASTNRAARSAFATSCRTSLALRARRARALPRSHPRGRARTSSRKATCCTGGIRRRAPACARGCSDDLLWLPFVTGALRRGDRRRGDPRRDACRSSTGDAARAGRARALRPLRARRRDRRRSTSTAWRAIDRGRTAGRARPAAVRRAATGTTA